MLVLVGREHGRRSCQQWDESAARVFFRFFLVFFVCFFGVAGWKGLSLSISPAAKMNSFPRCEAYCHPPGSADAGLPRQPTPEVHRVARLYRVALSSSI